MSEPAASPARPRMLDFRSGGWVLLASALLSAVVAASFIIASLRQTRTPLPGDGRNVATYGFDLSTCLVPSAQIVAAGLAKDELHALVDPKTLPAAQVGTQRLEGIRRLWPTDRVVGVTHNGAPRAYPLWILAWHEVCNDTLGGAPLLITYSPLCDAVVVFDRSGDDGPREFGVSGLLYNSNLLLYDRRPGAQGESLWSQLAFRAIAGPAAARRDRLTVLPAVVTTYAQWLARHPDTTVLVPVAERGIPYRRDAYLPYFGDEKLRFPVTPLPQQSPRGWGLKTPLVAVLRDGAWERQAVTDAVAPSADSGDEPRVYAFWFAWYALQEAAPSFE